VENSDRKLARGRSQIIIVIGTSREYGNPGFENLGGKATGNKKVAP